MKDPTHCAARSPNRYILDFTAEIILWFSTQAITSGYKPAFDKLKGQLDAAYGSSVIVTGGPGRNASFEVYADGRLVHSKLAGNGKLDTEGVPIWKEAECKALVAKLKPLIRAS